MWKMIRPGRWHPIPWEPRRIGIFFSKRDADGLSWTCLVLMQPGKRDYSELQLCVKQTAWPPENEADSEFKANAVSEKGQCMFQTLPLTLRNLISWLVKPVQSEKCSALEDLIEGILWGWHQYLSDVLFYLPEVSDLMRQVC